MNRFRESLTLQSILGSQFVVVGAPDHPELISGPDILVGGRGLSTAIFRISRRTMSELDARIVGARLALPAVTRFIGMVEPDAFAPDQKTVSLDDVVRSDDTKAVVRLCRTEPSEYHRRRTAELRDVQERHDRVSSTLLRVSEFEATNRDLSSGVQALVVRLQKRQGASEIEFANGERKSRSLDQEADSTAKRRSHPRFVRLQGSIVAALTSRGRQSALANLRPFWLSALETDFTLDNGVPYRRDWSPRVLLVDQWPSFRPDPWKPIRAAAFAGWITTSLSEEEDVNEIVNRAKEMIRKRSNA